MSEEKQGEHTLTINHGPVTEITVHVTNLESMMHEQTTYRKKEGEWKETEHREIPLEELAG